VRRERKGGVTGWRDCGGSGIAGDYARMIRALGREGSDEGRWHWRTGDWKRAGTEGQGKERREGKGGIGGGSKGSMEEREGGGISKNKSSRCRQVGESV